MSRHLTNVLTAGALAAGALTVGSLLAAPAATAAVAPADTTHAVADAAVRCAALPDAMQGKWPDSSVHVEQTRLLPATTQLATSPMPGAAPSPKLPEHCELIANLQQRQGALGQHYAIRFHLRMPTLWNGRFYFQGGGGSNGNLGDAVGSYSAAAAPALLQGFAVVSQDSGHDNATNNDPAHAGTLVFGFDAQARANYGQASLPLVAAAAKAAIAQYYGAAAHYSYFAGCSKGGAEAMAVSQRYAEWFDGVLAGAPGMSLPRAAVAEAWDTQAMAGAVPASPDGAATGAATVVTTGGAVTAGNLHLAFSDADFALVKAAVLEACDARDGLADGMVTAFTRCTTTRVRPGLLNRQCKGDKQAACLTAAQISALTRVMTGAHDSHGAQLYSDWPWDASMATPGWRLWKIGGAGGRPPAFNVVLGGGSLASVFTTPPTALPSDPDLLLKFLLKFDFDRDVPKINATNAEFPHSAWADISARSSDLDGLRARHGKLLVYHGVADPVFSVNDSIAWWREVDRRYHGKAAEFTRLFPVPGMTHCGGGDTTDRFDALTALMQWVEQGRAPERILATAGPQTPWPGRTRPLCVYPKVARYDGRGAHETAESFVCK